MKSLFNLVFLFDWGPEVTDELRVLRFHSIEGLVECFFLGEEHLVDINSGRSIVDTISIDFVEFQKNLSKRLFGLNEDGSSSGDGLFDFFDFSWDLPNFRKFDSLTLWLESIANSLDSVSDVLTVPENDDENRSLWLLNFVIFSVIWVLLNIHVRFTLGGSENQFSKSSDFLLFDNTSDVLNINRISISVLVIVEEVNGIVVVASIDAVIGSSLHVAHLLSQLALELWNHALGTFENLKLILQLGERVFVIFQLFILLLDETLLVTDVFLNFVKKQVDGLLLVVFDSFELGEETLDVFWWGNSDKVSLALVQQVLELALGFLTAFNLHCVRETIRNFLLI